MRMINLGFSSAVKQMLGDLCTAPRIISLSPLSLATDVTDAILWAIGLWPGIRTGAGDTVTLIKRLFWPQPKALWTAGTSQTRKRQKNSSKIFQYINREKK